MTREIIRAIDGGLHSLQVTQRDADTILRRIRAEEERQARPRRLPAPALAAALTVVLLCALLTFSLTRQPAEDVLIPLSEGTEATVFTPVPVLDPAERVKRFVEEVVLPFSPDSHLPGHYTAEEAGTLLSLAQERGITLSARYAVALRETMWRGEAIPRATLIMQLCESGLEKRFALWPMETQYWLQATVLSALGLQYGSDQYLLPGEGDMTREEAVQAARRAMEVIWPGDYARAITDASRYDVGVELVSGEFLASTESNDSQYPYSGRFWRVSFLPRNLTDRQFILYLSPEGKRLRCEDGDTGVSSGTADSSVRERFYNFYGDERAWSQETLYAFWQAMRQSGSTTHRWVLAAMRTIACPDVSSAKISASEAADAAKQAIQAPDALVQSAFLLMDEGAPVWRVWLTTREGDQYVEVGALTGVVVQQATLPLQELNGRDDPAWEMKGDDYRFYWAITLQEVIDEVESVWVGAAVSYG